MTKGMRWTLIAVIVIGAGAFGIYSANRTLTCREMLEEQGYGKNVSGTVTGMLASRSESDLVVFQEDRTSFSTGIFKLKDDTGVVPIYYIVGQVRLPIQNSVQIKVRFNTRRIILSQGGKPQPFFVATSIEELSTRDPG
ncbi:MAG: hypothetical protein L6R28_08930 [Planctomycetes bacterium]|nr:hypothetical protein [Planctomycetota bacterium]